METKQPALGRPGVRQVGTDEVSEGKVGRLAPVENRLCNVWSQECELEDVAYVADVTAFLASEIEVGAMMDGRQNPYIRADMVFNETPIGGGAVFSTGSISWVGSLTYRDYQNDVSQVTENVLRQFIDPTPFPHPGGA